MMHSNNDTNAYCSAVNAQKLWDKGAIMLVYILIGNPFGTFNFHRAYVFGDVSSDSLVCLDHVDQGNGTQPKKVFQMEGFLAVLGIGEENVVTNPHSGEVFCLPCFSDTEEWLWPLVPSPEPGGLYWVGYQIKIPIAWFPGMIGQLKKSSIWKTGVWHN